MLLDEFIASVTREKAEEERLAAIEREVRAGRDTCGDDMCAVGGGRVSGCARKADRACCTCVGCMCCWRQSRKVSGCLDPLTKGVCNVPQAEA